MKKSAGDFKMIAILLLDGLEQQIKKEILNISNWSHAAVFAAEEIHKSNQLKADKVFEKHFFKASQTTAYKRLYTPREITEIINKFTLSGKIKKYLECAAEILTVLNEVKKALENLKKAIKFGKALKAMGASSGAGSNAETAEDIEKQMEESIKKFAALMKALELLNTLSPPGFREYFEYGAGIFRGSQRLVTITKGYTQRLKSAAEETQSIWEKIFNNKNSKFNIDLKEKFLN